MKSSREIQCRKLIIYNMSLKSRSHFRNNSALPVKVKFPRAHGRAESSALPLVILEGKKVKKAPKIFENQIFVDVYDREGNHDRVLNISNLSDTGAHVIFKWNDNSPKENIIKKRLRDDHNYLYEMIKIPQLNRHLSASKKAFFS